MSEEKQDELTVLEPGQALILLEPGEAAIIIRDNQQSLEHEIVLTPDIEELFENGDDDDTIPLHVELAMALTLRLHEDRRFFNAMLKWYRNHNEKYPDGAPRLPSEEGARRITLFKGQVALIMRERDDGSIGSMVWSNGHREEDGDLVYYGKADAVAHELMSRVSDEKFISKVLGIRPLRRDIERG
jgi:hypothetical protein